MHSPITPTLEGDGAASVLCAYFLPPWRSVHSDRADKFPVTDNGLRRWQGGKRKFKTLRRVRRAAIRKGFSHVLMPYTITLGWVYAINDLAAFATARTVVLAVFGSAPATWKLEWGQYIGAHIQGVALKDVLEALPRQLEAAGLSVTIWHGDFDLSKGGALGWCQYLSKPPDPRAVRHNWERQPSDPVGASESHLAMKYIYFQKTGKRRPPVCSGVVNVPQPRKRKAEPCLWAYCALLDQLVQQISVLQEAQEQCRQRRIAFLKRWRLQFALRQGYMPVKVRTVEQLYTSFCDPQAVAPVGQRGRGPP